MSIPTPKQRAEEGIRWLDKHHPDWPTRTRGSLDIASGNMCVVARLSKSGRYSPESCKEVGVPDPVLYGFYVVGDQRSREVREEYASLTLYYAAGRDDRLKNVKTQVAGGGPTTTSRVKQVAMSFATRALALI